MMVVDVLFPIALRFNLSYRITENVTIGSFVCAPIGSRTFLGIVVAIHQSSELESGLKHITSIEGDLIPISPKRIELWRWISEYYLCTLGEVMKAATLSKPPRQSKLCTNQEPAPFSLPPLTPELTKVFQSINLDGVTLLKGAQGRVEIYLHLLRKVLLSGKNVLLLTPEIGSGDQLFRLFKELLGHCISLLHSRLTPVQRLKVVQTIAEQKEPMLIIGMRSALLLADMQYFGLIIIDDEHDFSYKQIDPAPRFHARDMALFVGRHYQIPVILGTSCPSLESEYNVRMGKFHIVCLNQSTCSQPNIEIVDTLRLRKKKQMNGSFSQLLLHALEHNLTLRKQALFFTHRCAQLQEELHTLLPQVRIARLDESHHPAAIQKIITQLKNREIDLIIGIQTIYTSIDWGNIGIVAIFDADRQLSRSDFRAHERTYQILTTILGNLKKILHKSAIRVIVQTEQSDHPFYRYLQACDSEAFVWEQLRERKEYQYPPFVRLIALRFKHANPETVLHTALQFKQELFEMDITTVTGPFTPWLNQEVKLHTQLLWIHLQRQSDGITLKRRIFGKVLAYKFPKGFVQVDVDPY